MAVAQNLTGKVFGRLTVLRKSTFKSTEGNCWICQCSCGSGKVMVVPINRLNRGGAKSCGCVRLEKITKHGYTKGYIDNKKYTDRFYLTYQSMWHRCYNPKNKRYADYGGRGIKVCDAWVNDMEAFINFVKALPNSDNPKLSLDRINNNGNYEPGNIRWATRSQQMHNTRRSINKGK